MVSLLREKLAPKIDALLAGSFFEWVRKGDFEKDDLHHFCSQYYLSSVAFPAFLGLTIANLVDEDQRRPFVNNLWDEFGAGKRPRSHRVMLARFCHACGVDDLEKLAPQPATRVYVDGLKALFASSEPSYIFGAMSLGCEDVTARMYEIILIGLERSGHFSREDVAFFTDHIRHDDTHTDDIIQMMDALGTGFDDSFLAGAEHVILLENVFWEGIAQGTPKCVA